MRLSSSSATAKEASKKRRTWALIRRLMLLPLAFALLHVPGSIRRSAKLTGFVARFYILLYLYLFPRFCPSFALSFCGRSYAQAAPFQVHSCQILNRRHHFSFFFFCFVCGRCEWCNSEAMQTIQGICDPSQGTVRVSTLYHITNHKSCAQLLIVYTSFKFGVLF
jgi:hypothetical protein